MSFMPLSANGNLCAVSKEFQEAAEGDCLWRDRFEERFEKPNCRHALEAVNGFIAEGAPFGAETAPPFDSTIEQSVVSRKPDGGHKGMIMRRLKDPQVPP